MCNRTSKMAQASDNTRTSISATLPFDPGHSYVIEVLWNEASSTNSKVFAMAIQPPWKSNRYLLEILKMNTAQCQSPFVSELQAHKRRCWHAGIYYKDFPGRSFNLSSKNLAPMIFERVEPIWNAPATFCWIWDVAQDFPSKAYFSSRMRSNAQAGLWKSLN